MEHPCCNSMGRQLAHACEQHPDPYDCPDALIGRDGRGHGIYVHDGGRSWVEIAFCPWCGSDLRSTTE